MKRDMDLVREILLWATAQERACLDTNPVIPGYTDEQIIYHLTIMQQAGLVTVTDIGSLIGSYHTAIISSVTWSGHDFIDAARDDTVWNKAKTKVIASGAAFTFDLLKEILVLAAKGPLGLN